MLMLNVTDYISAIPNFILRLELQVELAAKAWFAEHWTLAVNEHEIPLKTKMAPANNRVKLLLFVFGCRADPSLSKILQY